MGRQDEAREAWKAGRTARHRASPDTTERGLPVHCNHCAKFGFSAEGLGIQFVISASHASYLIGKSVMPRC